MSLSEYAKACEGVTAGNGMREEVLAAVLAADNSLSRDEPEVAANIGQQLEHMGLTTWSISVRRRIRDSIARLEPKKIIQT